jgi:hypothetical protein
MKCYYHPEIEAVATCSNCGRAICQADTVSVSGKIVCQQCLATGKATNTTSTATAKPTNSLAMVSIGLGILGLAGCFCFGAFGSIFGVLAGITGYLARKQIGASQGTQEGMQLATTGMILGVVEATLGLIAFLCVGGIYGTGFFLSLLEQLQY